MPPEANLCSQGPPRPLLRGVLVQKSSNSGPKLTTFSIIPDPSHPSNPSSPSNPLHPIIQGSKHPSLQASKPPMASAGCAKRKQSARPFLTKGPGRAEPRRLTILTHHLPPQKSPPWPSRCPPRQSAHPSFFTLFFQLDFCSPKYPQNGPKISRKSTRNLLKIASQSHVRFYIQFHIDSCRFPAPLVSLQTFRITLSPAREHDFHKIDLPT